MNSRSWEGYAFALALLTLFGSRSLAQCEAEPDTSVDFRLFGTGPYESRNGWAMTTSGVVRVLAILIEVDYGAPSFDPTGLGGFSEWPSDSLPIWVDNPDPTQ